MSENGNELWKIYERFGVAIGLIVDLAAIIAFILQPRLVGGSIDYEVDTTTVYGLMAIALIYSLGFINYQFYKRWRTRGGEIISMVIYADRRLALSGLITFPALIVYFHSLYTARSTSMVFANALVTSLFSSVLFIPLVAGIGSLFEIVILGNSKWDDYNYDTNYYEEPDYYGEDDQPQEE